MRTLLAIPAIVNNRRLICYGIQSAVKPIFNEQLYWNRLNKFSAKSVNAIDLLLSSVERLTERLVRSEALIIGFEKWFAIGINLLYVLLTILRLLFAINCMWNTNNKILETFIIEFQSVFLKPVMNVNLRPQVSMQSTNQKLIIWISISLKPLWIRFRFRSVDWLCVHLWVRLRVLLPALHISAVRYEIWPEMGNDCRNERRPVDPPVMPLGSVKAILHRFQHRLNWWHNLSLSTTRSFAR